MIGHNDRSHMVDEAELVRRVNNFKGQVGESTWKEVCLKLAIRLIEVEMRIEELSRKDPVYVDLKPATDAADKILEAIIAKQEVAKPKESLKGNLLRTLMGKKIKNP